MTLGFLLHPTYRIESGKPAVYLFGKLETGETFAVRDRRSQAHFFIRAADATRARAHLRPGSVLESTKLVTMAAEQVARLVVPTPADTPPLRESLHAAGIATFEADIPFATRFLIDRGLRGSVRIEGASRPGRLVDRIYEDPELSPADFEPELRVLSIDIETDASVQRILSIGLYAPGVEEVHLIHLGPGPLPAAARPHPDERRLLLAFLERLRAIDPDVLLGWNLIDFDLSVLQSRFREHRIDFHLGRAEMPCSIRVDRSFWGASRATVPGRVALDGVALLRGAFIRLEDYRLDTAAREILGEGKTVAGHGRAAWIEQAFVEDVESFIHYNLTDARLAYGIVEKLALIPLAIRRSRLTGMPLDRVGASIASFDFLYLHELRKRGIVAPTVDAEAESEPTTGGTVLEDEPVEAFIRGFVAELRTGECDGQLIYTKALRKSPENYTKTTPPHVKAARQMTERDGRLISYRMTAAGPEPVDGSKTPPDYDHYVEKQIRPIAEAVLACMGSSWERVWSGQEDLFV